MTGRTSVMDRSQEPPLDRPSDAPDERVDADVGEHDLDPTPSTPRRSILKRSFVGLIHLYQMLSANRPPSCRYTPSCSHYAVEAIEIHGVGRGSWLAAKRLGRCRPFGSFGYDPVPERRSNSAFEPGPAPAVDPDGPAGTGGLQNQ